MVNKTLITHSRLQLNSIKEKYELMKTENVKSKCSVSDFQRQEPECLKDDLFQKNLKK
jgi:hypothetical protein